jgi:hypothetical protein
MLPTLGLKPTQPQKPTTCVPSAAETMQQATAAAEPLLDPPGVRSISHGLCVPRGSVEANSVITALPRITVQASRSDTGGIAAGAPADRQRRALFGRHIGGLDDVLDRDWHTVDWRQRPPGTPPLGGKVRGSARRADVVADERPDRRLELLETRETAFEQVARRVGAGWEIAGGRGK